MDETVTSVSPTDFVSAMNHFASGVAVVTARLDGRPVGATVAAIAPIASDPPTVMVSMSVTSGTAAAIIESGSFAVNVLDEDSAMLAGVFASRVPDKFVGIDVDDDCLGSPLLAHRVAAISCRVVDAVASGSHWELRGRTVAVDVTGGNPLAYYRGAFAHVDTDADRTVLDAVRAHVLSVRTDNDHHLDPDALATSFAVSRGAVLRALSRLKSEALVDREDGVYYVTGVSDEVVDAAYAAKLVLELGVACQIVERITDSEVAGLRDRLTAVGAAAALNGDDAIERLVTALDDAGEYFVGLAGSDPLLRAYRSLGLPGIDRRTITRAMLANIAPGGELEGVVEALERRDLAALMDALRSERRKPAYVRARAGEKE
ncbi:flavin reductase [Microbacterium sp. F51-2R]|uniref:flavin reductase n=1 Tax=Microbacterium sp. F51-2R TaxID=3445777 RepID=UPI003FA1409B